MVPTAGIEPAKPLAYHASALPAELRGHWGV